MRVLFRRIIETHSSNQLSGHERELQSSKLSASTCRKHANNCVSYTQKTGRTIHMFNVSANLLLIANQVVGRLVNFILKSMTILMREIVNTRI